MTHTDLWSEASRDIDAEHRTRNLEIAKAASQGLWGFLAQAQSPEEYGHRVALATDQIMSTASAAGVEVADLVRVFDTRFALLMEAADNPFAKDDSEDSGDSDDDSDGDDSDDSSDDDDNDNDDNDDDSDDSDDGDDSDSSDDSSDSDDDSGDPENDADGDTDSAPPWADKFSALAARINRGENPLTWGGGTPFAHSSARKEAADGAEDMPEQEGVDSTTDPSVPPADGPEGVPGPPSPDVPGMNGGIAETTKPRQTPGGSGMDPSAAPGMGMDGIDGPPADDSFDPAMNGGDIQQGADDLPPSDDAGRTAKIRAIAFEVKKYNPTLSPGQCRKVAGRVYDQYLVKHAEDMSPLLFGDRGGVADGPATHRVKQWSPADFKPQRPGESSGEEGEGGGEPPGGGGGIPIPPVIPRLPGGGAAGAGEVGAAGATAEIGEAAAAARMLPLLAL